MRTTEILGYLFLILLLVMCSKSEQPTTLRKETVCLGELVFGTIYNEQGKAKYFIMDNDGLKYIVSQKQLAEIKVKQLSGITDCISIETTEIYGK